MEHRTGSIVLATAGRDQEGLFFVVGMALTVIGWKMTGELLGLGLMLVGVVLLLVALFVYNALYK